MATQKINFITWNVNGLRQNREQKLHELQSADVVFLQETHIGIGDENFVEAYKDEWYIFFTTYTSSSKGTAILVRKVLDFEHKSNERDHCGAYVVLKCKLGGQLYTLVSVYNHETDTKTLDNLSRYLQSMATGLLVIGGDFNTVLNPFIDRQCNTNINHRKLLSLERFMKSLQLVDVWRRKNPMNQDCTYYIRDSPVSRLDYFFVPEECMWRVRSCEIRDSRISDHRPVSLELNIPAVPFKEHLQKQASLELLNLKKDLLPEEMGLLLEEESSHAVSEVDIVSAVNSLQVSDTSRPDGIPVSFYRDNIQLIIPYIKMLYEGIHRGAFNCPERYFNESLKTILKDSHHFFNVDYLIIATILARYLDDFLKPVSKGKLKHPAIVMITSKTPNTQRMLCHLKDELKEQNQSNSTLYRDFLTVENLLRDSEDFSAQEDNLLCQGCPLTPVLISSKLKCYALKLCKDLENYAIHVFETNVTICIPPEDLDKAVTMGNRTNEEYDIKTLSSGRRDKLHNESPGEECDELKEDEDKYSPESEMESQECEESDYGLRTTMYAVVTLQDSDELLVAPTNWLSEDKKQCYWPPFKSPQKCMEAVENRLEPSTGGKPWEKVAILFQSEYGTYERAKEKQEELSEQKEQPVTQNNQAIEISPLYPGPSQSALSGIFSRGPKRKLETCDSYTSAKLHPGNPSFKQNTDMFILKNVKHIMTEVQIRIQNINSTDQTSTEQKNNILDAIAKMDKMDKDKRRKETIGVFGKTGQGKSSLLNAILGLDYFLPSGSFGSCTSVVTQVEANLIDSNYTAEIELISKEEWENEITSTDHRTDTVIERITALYGADAEKKTLEELKRDKKYAEIDNFLSTKTKTISQTEVSEEFTNDVARYIQHGDWYWPLVKSVTIKIPNCPELLEHIVLVDLPGTGDCNKIRDDLWKTKLRDCSSVWIVSNINRAIDDKDPWGIIQYCIQDLGPGGECRNIDFICTKTDEIDPKEYLRSVRHPEKQISLDKNPTGCIIHRNNRAKEIVKKKLENLEIMKSKARFITDVFTVSSRAYLEKNPHLEPAETEIPKLQDFLKNTNRRINRELTRDYVNEAKGVLSFIQSIQPDTDEKMVEKKTVLEALQKNLKNALKELDCQLDSLSKILDQCLSKGVEESVEQCVNTKNSMIDSVAPKDKRGFHKTLQALYKNKGYYWPKKWDGPLDLNMCLAKHMHDNIDEKFNLIFPVDGNNKTGKSVQEQIDKFSIIQSGSAYSPSSMLYHMENFIKTEETKVKALLKREVVVRKKEIYSSIQKTIQNQMTAGYEKAAKLTGDKAMERRENKITETIDLLKHSMFEDAKMEVLNRFKDLKEHICKTLEFELKRSVERSLSQTSRTPLIDVTGKIERLERLSRSVI